jgi:hypothetical protein
MAPRLRAEGQHGPWRFGLGRDKDKDELFVFRSLLASRRRWSSVPRSPVGHSDGAFKEIQ